MIWYHGRTVWESGLFPILDESWCIWFVNFCLQLPPEWTDQFESGIQVWSKNFRTIIGPFSSPVSICLIIEGLFFFSLEQTIAVIQAGHGLLQLGSCKIVSFFFADSWLVLAKFESLLIFTSTDFIDTWRSAFCVEDETYIWIFRIPIWFLLITAILFNKKYFIHNPNSSYEATNYADSPSSSIQLGRSKAYSYIKSCSFISKFSKLIY